MRKLRQGLQPPRAARRPRLGASLGRLALPDSGRPGRRELRLGRRVIHKGALCKEEGEAAQHKIEEAGKTAERESQEASNGLNVKARKLSTVTKNP